MDWPAPPCIIVTMTESLGISCCCFFAEADIRVNAEAIRAAINETAQIGNALLLTPECGLIGYPGQGRSSLEEIDWGAVAALEDDLAEHALERGIILVLGSASPASEGLTNDALVCGAIEEEQRYRKRCLTPFDETQFVAGHTQTVFHCRGWTLGLTICYEVRFPVLWGDLVKSGVDCFVHIAHMGGEDPDPGVKPVIVPQHYASRAAEYATPVVMCNTAAENRWLDSGHWDPRGMLVASCDRGMLHASVAPREAYAPFYAKIHANARNALDLRIEHDLLSQGDWR